MVAGLPSLAARLLALARSSAVTYAGATGLSALCALLLTRLLWLRMDPHDFGVWVLADALLLVAGPFLLLGLDHALIKQVRLDGRPVAPVLGAALPGCVPAMLLGLVTAAAILWAFGLGWAWALLPALATEALYTLIQAAFRASNRPVGFAALLVARAGGYVALVAMAPLALGRELLGLEDVFLIRAGWMGLVCAAGLVALRPAIRWQPAEQGAALRYGFPLLLAIVIHAVAELADRVALAWLAGPAAVGVYALHLKLASILSQAVVVPFGLWFPPERLRHMADPDRGEAFYRTTADMLLALCLVLGGALWLARDPLIGLIAPGLVASPLVLGLCVASTVCLALGQVFNVGMMLPGQTGKNAICMLASAMTAAIAAAVLVPLLQGEGAALARLAGGVVFVGVTAAWSWRLYPVGFPFARMALQGAAAVLALAALDGTFLWPGAVLIWVPVAGLLGLVPLLGRRAALSPSRPLEDFS